ncbi:hypothetical protein LOAG_01439 [Loa loa]|uniref:Uncharacterized protein n=1 Tax=Loa loa TaxID=7209 RepID=A0A1S0U914_LOALO|nr:hypothetical protein LOAG_01439 [Loa loa]EFO27041.1 hypothetical protein LOAG_01439 [Loa loa]
MDGKCRRIRESRREYKGGIPLEEAGKNNQLKASAPNFFSHRKSPPDDKTDVEKHFHSLITLQYPGISSKIVLRLFGTSIDRFPYNNNNYNLCHASNNGEVENHCNCDHQTDNILTDNILINLLCAPFLS